MLEGARIGLKVDVDTLRGTREGVPRLVEALKNLSIMGAMLLIVSVGAGPNSMGRS